MGSVTQPFYYNSQALQHFGNNGVAIFLVQYNLNTQYSCYVPELLFNFRLLISGTDLTSLQLGVRLHLLNLKV